MTIVDVAMKCPPLHLNFNTGLIHSISLHMVHSPVLQTFAIYALWQVYPFVGKTIKITLQVQPHQGPIFAPRHFNSCAQILL